MRDLQEPQDLAGWLAPQALLDPQDSVGTPASRALLASQESPALTESGVYREL